MKYYLQVRNNGIITDVITYPCGDYTEYETSEPLPIGVTGGWFKLEDGQIIEYPELKPAPETEITALEERLAETELDVDFRLSILELGIA